MKSEVPPVDLRRGDCQELEAFLAERIYEFNSRTTGYFDGESFGAMQRGDSGTILAGISGYTWGGCCYVCYLWVAEEHRGQGLGSALLQAAEKSARDKGCTVAFLSSHSFQSPGFYKHLGYEEQASIKRSIEFRPWSRRRSRSMQSSMPGDARANANLSFTTRPRLDSLKI